MPAPGEPSWKWRRIVILTSSAVCFLMLGSLIDKADSELNGTIASGLLWLLGVLILGYTGFATAQDVAAIVTTRTGRPYAMQPPPPTPAPGDDKTLTVVTQGEPDPNAPPPGFAT